MPLLLKTSLRRHLCLGVYTDIKAKTPLNHSMKSRTIYYLAQNTQRVMGTLEIGS